MKCKNVNQIFYLRLMKWRVNDFVRFSRMGSEPARVFHEPCSFDNGDVYCISDNLLNTRLER